MKRRGVSEIISTIIIILIVSVVGTSLYSYSMTLFQRNNDIYFKETELVTAQARERFNVPVVWQDGNATLHIVVYNFGEIDINIDDVYIDGVRVSSYSFGENEDILRDKLHQIAFNSPINIIGGVSYRIRVVTDRGVGKTFDWEA